MSDVSASSFAVGSLFVITSNTNHKQYLVHIYDSNRWTYIVLPNGTGWISGEGLIYDSGLFSFELVEPAPYKDLLLLNKLWFDNNCVCQQ